MQFFKDPCWYWIISSRCQRISTSLPSHDFCSFFFHRTNRKNYHSKINNCFCCVCFVFCFYYFCYTIQTITDRPNVWWQRDTSVYFDYAHLANKCDKYNNFISQLASWNSLAKSAPPIRVHHSRQRVMSVRLMYHA